MKGPILTLGSRGNGHVSSKISLFTISGKILENYDVIQKGKNEYERKKAKGLKLFPGDANVSKGLGQDCLYSLQGSLPSP